MAAVAHRDEEPLLRARTATGGATAASDERGAAPANSTTTTGGSGGDAGGGTGGSTMRVAGESDALLAGSATPIMDPPPREFNVVAFYFVICVVGFVQGSSNLSKLATEYFFKDDVHFSPAQLSIASGLISAPWVIKPVYGFISDSYPILRRRRTPYFLIFGLTGWGFYMIMAYLVKAAVPAVLTLFGASLSICFCNVLAEALIVERGKSEQSHVQPDAIKNKVTWYMTVFWGTESFTKIFSGYFSGQLLEIVSKRTIFIATSIAPLFLVVLAFVIQEPPRTDEQPTLSAEKTAKSVWGALKQRRIWGPMLFVFLLMIAPSSQASFFFFLTNELKLNPAFMGTLALVEGVSSIIGLLLYNFWLKRFSYKCLLIVMIVLSVIAGATPLLLIFHINRQMGIPDRWFCIGDTALLNAIGQISIMPLLCLGAETCPKDVEATLYSFLMSTLNIGSLLSTQLGGLITWAVGVTAHDFHNLWLLCVICNFSSLAVLPLIVLVPDKAHKKQVTTANILNATTRTGVAGNGDSDAPPHANGNGSGHGHAMVSTGTSSANGNSRSGTVYGSAEGNTTSASGGGSGEAHPSLAAAAAVLAAPEPGQPPSRAVSQSAAQRP